MQHTERQWAPAFDTHVRWREDSLMFDCACGVQEVVLMGGDSWTCDSCGRAYRLIQNFEVSDD